MAFAMDRSKTLKTIFSDLWIEGVVLDEQRGDAQKVKRTRETDYVTSSFSRPRTGCTETRLASFTTAFGNERPLHVNSSGISSSSVGWHNGPTTGLNRSMTRMSVFAGPVRSTSTARLGIRPHSRSLTDQWL